MKNIIIIALLIMASGCSTLMNGTDQAVKIDNHFNVKEPIKVYTPHSEYLDIMPTRINISSGVQSGQYSIKLDNGCSYEQKLNLNKTLRGSYWLNLFNVFGFFVDYATGAMWAYPEKVYMATSGGTICKQNVASQ
jgi:hypothetical protein